MESFNQNWYYVLSAIIAIGGIMGKLIHWFHKRFISDRFEAIEKEVQHQAMNYTKKFEQTNKKIDNLDDKIDKIDVATSNIEGQLKTLIKMGT